MKVGLIDVDGHRGFPNLPLMKLSAWHKKQGDSVEWYYPLTSGHMDRVYKSKVFTFSPDYMYYVDADEVISGGTGYRYPDGGEPLPQEIEHIYPDYGIYGIEDTAYGFLTRGCPRGCDFCIVKDKEGKRSVKAANLDEFWHGQPYIEALDPNFFACRDWEDLAGQLIESEAWVNFNQGVDARVMTAEKIEAIRRMKMRAIHFAWDRYEDKDKVLPKLQMFREITGWDHNRVRVYVLTNYNTTIEQDLERIYTLRDLDCDPYVMIYDKGNTRNGDDVRRLQRWVNNKYVWRKCKTFEEYKG